jgi:ATP-binding cassette subfamily F protein 3
LIEWLKTRVPQWEDHLLYALIRRFHFTADEAHKPIGLLSPGGRARLLLAMCSAIKANVLVLDEPTNHLDLEAIEALEEVLATYTGTMILVSHDRYFLERANLNHTYLLREGRIEFIRDYRTYAESVTAEAKRLLRRMTG